MRVAFTTLGCRLNQFETEGMRHRVAAHTSLDVVEWDAPAEVYVINSCAVTARAEQKCRQLARAAKRALPFSKVMVVGCYGQLQGPALSRMPEVDAVLGNEEKRRIETYLERVAGGEIVTEVSRYRRGLAMAAEWIDTFEGHSRATIKVQEGCDLRCAFCSIWKARGPSRSRPPRDVVEQAQHLARRGYEEIVLAGVHLGHYGRDLATPTHLLELLEMLLEVVDARVRLRLSSIDPGEVDASLVRRLAEDDRLCRYLHLPLQSGSNRVLQRMRRAYRRETFVDLVRTIQDADPLFGIGADVIVGFPGEDEAAFEETLELLEALPVSFYHVFRYSDRPGTPAAAMDGRVGGPESARRAARLRRLGEAKRQSFLRRHVGRVLDGIVEGPVGRDGRETEVMLDTYATVRVPIDRRWDGRRVAVRVDRWTEDGALAGSLVQTSAVAGEVAVS
jgi:threonylcarbamoyladenosine tRNA methylthiotransferase MtaB